MKSDRKSSTGIQREGYSSTRSEVTTAAAAAAKRTAITTQFITLKVLQNTLKN